MACCLLSHWERGPAVRLHTDRRGMVKGVSPNAPTQTLCLSPEPSAPKSPAPGAMIVMNAMIMIMMMMVVGHGESSYFLWKNTIATKLGRMRIASMLISPILLHTVTLLVRSLVPTHASTKPSPVGIEARLSSQEGRADGGLRELREQPPQRGHSLHWMFCWGLRR